MTSFIYSLFQSKPSVDPKHLDVSENSSQDDLAKAIGRKYGAKLGDTVSTGHFDGEYYAKIIRPSENRIQIIKAAELGPKFEEVMKNLQPTSTERPPLRGCFNPGIYQPEQPSSAANAPLKSYLVSPLTYDPVKKEYTDRPPTPIPAGPRAEKVGQTTALAASSATIALYIAAQSLPTARKLLGRVLSLIPTKHKYTIGSALLMIFAYGGFKMGRKALNSIASRLNQIKSKLPGLSSRGNPGPPPP
jgi:hypothetical protein